MSLLPGKKSVFSWCVLSLAAIVPALAVCIPTSAAPRTVRTARERAAADAALEEEAEEAAAASAPQISLNYLQASWRKVLQDVAKATHTELVAEKFPAKAFSRVDRKLHTPEEMLRILNNDLEKQGYKLRLMQKHLVLIELRRIRKEYSRAEISPEPETDELAEAANGEHAAGRDGKSSLLSQDGGDRGHPARTPARGLRGTVKPAVQPAGAEEPSPGKSPQQIKITAAKLKSRKAQQLGKIIYEAFETQAEEITSGPRGMPGYQVFRPVTGEPTDDRPVRFRIGVDEAGNQLLVEATAAESAAVLRLIQMLDAVPAKASGAVKVVPGVRDAARVAATLQPELKQLLVATQRTTPAVEAAAREEKTEVAAAQPPAAGGNPPAGEAPGAAPLASGLKGEVTVESVSELGILILRGNEKDVESVMSVIREIERISVGATPKVELRLLANIPSDSLASLLTTVYERLNQARGRAPANNQQGQPVKVLPINRPNAVLIIAPAAEIESIKALADEFDRPGNPEAGFRVFRLKHAIASRIVTQVTALYPPPQPQAVAGQNQATLASLAPRVRIVGDLRTNSVVVQAEARDIQEITSVIRKLDVPDAAAVAQMRIFPLKSAAADEISATLQNAIQGVLNPPRTPAAGLGQLGAAAAAASSGQGAPELREIKSTIIEFLDRDKGAGKVRSGVLSDIRFTSDVRTNCLVVTAPQESLELIEKLIERLDRPSSAVAEIKVFSLSNSDATTMVQLLDRLFNQQNNQQRQGAGPGGQMIPGIMVAGAEDAGSAMIPLRFSVDVRTNSVIAIGGAEALRVVEAVLLRLDESDVRQRKNMVYRLKNAPALDVATAIGQFLQTQRQVENIDPGLVSPFEQIEREVVVVPEVNSNSLLISATPRYFEEILEVIKKVDEPPKQVIIQAMLVEVTLDNTDEFGMELGLQDSILFDRSLISQLVQVATTNTSPNGVVTTNNTVVSQTSTPGYLFNTQNGLGNNTSTNLNTGRVGGQGLSNFSVGRVNGDLGYGGLVLSAGSESVNILLRALASRRRVDVLSRPQIRTVDNQYAEIQVGQEVPRVNQIQINQQTGNAQPLVLPRAVGIILNVTPRISPDGMVVMEVVARKDALNPQGVPLFTNTNGTVITSPIIDTTNARTTVSVKSNQTVVLGGMITKTDDTTERKVPLLGDIPLIGQLFRYDSKRMRRTELLIFMTPRIITNDAEAEMIKEIEAQRIHFIEEEAEAIHGPLFAVPGQSDPYLPSHISTEPCDFIPPRLLDAQGHAVKPEPQEGVQPVPVTPPAPSGTNGPPAVKSSAAKSSPELPALDEVRRKPGNSRRTALHRDSAVMPAAYEELPPSPDTRKQKRPTRGESSARRSGVVRLQPRRPPADQATPARLPEKELPLLEDAP